MSIFRTKRNGLIFRFEIRLSEVESWGKPPGAAGRGQDARICPEWRQGSQRKLQRAKKAGMLAISFFIMGRLAADFV